MKPITYLIAFIFPKPLPVRVGDQLRILVQSDIYLVMAIQGPLIYLRNVSRAGLQQVFVYALNDIVRKINNKEMEVWHGSQPR